jgi:hypothetical protein
MVTLATLYNDFKTLIKQNFYDKTETDTLVNAKQDTLVSGTNIKTINNNSLLGSGNISISASGTVDSALDTTSTNPVQNQAIANAIDDIETDVTSLNNSITNITSWESINLLNGLTLVYNPALRLAKLTVNRSTSGTLSTTTFTNITGFHHIPADYRPHINLIFQTSYPTLMLRVDTSGYLQWRVTSGSVSSPTLWCESPFWHY